jgi:hypothetical protein
MQDLVAAVQLAGLVADRAVSRDYHWRPGVMTQIWEWGGVLMLRECMLIHDRASRSPNQPNPKTKIMLDVKQISRKRGSSCRLSSRRARPARQDHLAPTASFE